MLPIETSLDARLRTALAASPAAAPVVTGWCGSGRTAALLRLREALGAARCQYVDVERIATTPERFFRSLVSHSPFKLHRDADLGGMLGSPRGAFDAALVFLGAAHTREGEPATFLLDEALELRTFESFPGLRSVMADLVAAIEGSPNRFVLTSRFAVRARRFAAGAAPRLAVADAPSLSVHEVAGALADDAAAPDVSTAAAVHALTGGHLGHVRALAAAMAAMGGGDPLSALAQLLAPGAPLSGACRFCYELRLHRARGYGALKAILDVLAQEEPLTLSAVAQRLARTPGSTKDYLTWLEDVDLVQAARKRYRITDPLLKLWIRLYGRPCPPTDDDLAREIHRYASERLPLAQAIEAPAGSPTAPEPEPVSVPRRDRPAVDRSWGIIEID